MTVEGVLLQYAVDTRYACRQGSLMQHLGFLLLFCAMLHCSQTRHLCRSACTNAFTPRAPIVLLPNQSNQHRHGHRSRGLLAVYRLYEALQHLHQMLTCPPIPVNPFPRLTRLFLEYGCRLDHSHPVTYSVTRRFNGRLQCHRLTLS